MELSAICLKDVSPESMFQYIDENQDHYIKKFAKWVTIQCVLSWPKKRGEISMVEVASADIQQLRGSVELVGIGKRVP